MKNYLSLIYLIIFTFIFTQNNKDNNEPSYIPAYDFNLSVFNDLGQDSTIQLSSLKGNVVLLNFWATWCGPCIAEIPEFNELYDAYNSKGFEILGVSVSDNYKQLKKFSNKIEVEYKMLFGSSEEMAVVIQNYGGFYSVPVSYLINKDGLIVRGYPGAIIGDYWSSLLKDDIIKFLSEPYLNKSLDSIKVID
tara:strand:- start:5109 stop:5684 length:576 start_codon:yes stop_codon:yes gene_type:complete